jgi:hypothetical protein
MIKNEFFPLRHTTNSVIYAYEMVGVSAHRCLLKI